MGVGYCGQEGGGGHRGGMPERGWNGGVPDRDGGVNCCLKINNIYEQQRRKTITRR